MRPVFACLAALVFAGCATPRAEKMSFAEAFGDDQPLVPAQTQPVPRVKANTRTVASAQSAGAAARAEESLELQAELARFSAAARQARAHTRRGAPMPLVQQENWNRVLDAIDRFLARAPEQTASTDVISARVAAEAELDMDAQVYGDFPALLAERVMDQVTKLAVRMAKLRRLQVRPTRPKLTFEWPIEPVVVTSLFGRRMHPITHVMKPHYGVDLSAYGGQLVSAAAKGTVIRAGWHGAHGVQVEIQHPGGIITRYSHLSAVLVEEGTVVEKGDPIGLAGTTGLSTGTHLHFEFWRDGRPRDPLEEMAQHSDREAVAGVPRS